MQVLDAIYVTFNYAFYRETHENCDAMKVQFLLMFQVYLTYNVDLFVFFMLFVVQLLYFLKLIHCFAGKNGKQNMPFSHHRPLKEENANSFDRQGSQIAPKTRPSRRVVKHLKETGCVIDRPRNGILRSTRTPLLRNMVKKMIQRNPQTIIRKLTNEHNVDCSVYFIVKWVLVSNSYQRHMQKFI